MDWIKSIYNEHFYMLMESVIVITGLIYVILIARNNLLGWLFGIISSFLSIFLFIFYAKLYSEAILYSFYVVAGFYGWYYWSKQKETKEVYQLPIIKHIIIIASGLILSCLLYLLMTNLFSDAARPFIDALTTIFSFIATYMATRKWIGNWIYWVVIDIISVWLYFSRGLELYALLMLIYSVIAIFGYLQWKKLKLIKDE